MIRRGQKYLFSLRFDDDAWTRVRSMDQTILSVNKLISLKTFVRKKSSRGLKALIKGYLRQSPDYTMFARKTRWFNLNRDPCAASH